jgi:hypothetical protein
VGRTITSGTPHGRRARCPAGLDDDLHLADGDQLVRKLILQSGGEPDQRGLVQ